MKNNKVVTVTHIHSNLNFIYGTSFFDGPLFNNKIIFIGDKNSYDGIYKDKALFFKCGRSSVRKIIKLCSSSDLVVFYNLDTIKSVIANRLPQHIKLAWRFFGYELYDRRIEYYQSDLTKKYCELDLLEKTRRIIEKQAKGIKHLMIWHSLYKMEFFRAMKKIDFIIGLSKLEHEQLKSFWSELPNFVQSPFDLLENAPPIDISKKEDLILLGNSMSPYNNHFDIVGIIEQQFPMTDYKFILPFSYAGKNKYSKILRNRISNNPKFVLIENFVSFNEYALLFSKVRAAVYNCYRQMGMGNILLALNSGVKVYLNKRNVMLQSLMDYGFLVFSIDEFKNDFKQNELQLSYAEAIHNRGVYEQILNNYNKNEFQKIIYDHTVN
ncbi:MAG: hypothetical protein COY66_00295 [Candidatus Kerfeldbacteria bacterium CG_4_10_14_0_8_um_filter_42_10]|uniref:4-alpha-L-fucosyltransferase n=1 Tax=Candidatus Kerfeldbacteria bacterium CG_4_10_14_0_8_um_filter_42_10 TaxID=2014248 RepID=A0A2M7RKN4_9BACT|nr:MAG: hypothetical protein COY66_00295 [Candidatus Kerfeldbacteria bacterium CG_4_10_14_0_8_um_filter_42_10]